MFLSGVESASSSKSSIPLLRATRSAVSGISCSNPIAPADDITSGRKLLSSRMMAHTRAGSMIASAATAESTAARKAGGHASHQRASLPGCTPEDSESE